MSGRSLGRPGQGRLIACTGELSTSHFPAARRHADEARKPEARDPADVTGRCPMARIEGVSKSQAGPIVKLVYRFGPRMMKKMTGRDPQTGKRIEQIEIRAS